LAKSSRELFILLPSQLCAKVFIVFAKGGCMSDDLRQKASDVWANAYAPYSNFKVGAALRAASGTIYVGCNVENVAYPEGTCAEAGAIAAMVAAGETELVEAYVIAGSPTPAPPCGGCRQKLAEFGKGDVQVTMATTSGIEEVMRLSELLPGAFGRVHMEG
jgi:cytidine deaminase